MEGYINVDFDPSVKPDLVIDLIPFRPFNHTRPRWPWDDSSIEEIQLYHVLESVDDVLYLFREAYRVLVPGGRIVITVNLFNTINGGNYANCTISKVYMEYCSNFLRLQKLQNYRLGK